MRARKQMGMGAGEIAGDPGRRAALAARHETVAADGELQGDRRSPFGDPEHMTERHLAGLIVEHAFRHLDAGGAQPRDPVAGGARIGIVHGDHDTRGRGGGDGVGAGRSPALMGARLKRHIEGCVGSGAPGPVCKATASA